MNVTINDAFEKDRNNFTGCGEANSW